jgi:hypothetical protein
LAKYRSFETSSFVSNLEELGKVGAIRIHEKLEEFVYPQFWENLTTRVQYYKAQELGA